MTGGSDISEQPALLDRAGEIELLRRAVADLGRGKGRAVVIEGPPGIGKTALLDVARNLARSAEYQVLEVCGTELTADVSFGAVRDMFAVADSHRLDSPTLDGAARAVLDDVVDTTAPAPGEFAALQALHQLTADIAGGEPLVVIADDAHWIDPTSLRYLAYLASVIGQQPLLLVIATRPHVDAARKAALEQLLASPMVDVRRPRPLDRESADRLLTARLGRPTDPTFAAVCFRETAGNPLMLGQLAAAVTAAGVAPTADNSTFVRKLGSRSIRAYVDDRLVTCPAPELAVLQAIAVLADGTAIDQVAALAGTTPATLTTGALAALAVRGLLAGTGAGTTFVHPLIRAAVYDGIDPTDRARMHLRAAELLITTGAGVESVAAHYLRDPTEFGPPRLGEAGGPSAGSPTTAVLRRAAAEAQRRGAPESALRYLRRGIATVGSGPERDAMVLAAGRAAFQVDLPNSLDYLTQSLQFTRDAAVRFRLLGDLFGALLLTGRIGAALELIRDELDRIPVVAASVDPYDDLRRYIGAGIAMVAINSASLPSSGELAELVALRPATGLGGRTLDGTLSMYQAFRANPEAIERAGRAVSDGVLLAVDNGRGPRMMALDVLLVADQPQALGLLDDAASRATREGSLLAVSGAYTYRGRGLLVRGELEAAYRDASTARWATGICGLENRSFVAQVLADTCLELGRWDEARAALEWSDVLAASPERPFTYFALASWAALERTTGNPEQGLRLALLAGERFAAVGGVNPALVGWRHEAALCLHALGDRAAAMNLAAQDLSIAHRWTAPRSLGRALRLVAAVGDGQASGGVDLLAGAVELLRPTIARLELAECLVALGQLKLKAGFDGSSDLADGLALATRCGARPLADRATAALRAAGEQPPD